MCRRSTRELKQVNETVTALTMNIDPANLSLLNERMTQLRLRKERLEEEIAAASQAVDDPSEQALRQWAREKLAGFQAAASGIRDDQTRDAIAAYVDHIKIWPSKKKARRVGGESRQPRALETPRPPLRTVAV